MGYFGVHQGTGIGLLMLRSRLQEKMGTKKRSHLIKNAIATSRNTLFFSTFPWTDNMRETNKGILISIRETPSWVCASQIWPNITHLSPTIHAVVPNSPF
jgi:hypothetical protein